MNFPQQVYDLSNFLWLKKPRTFSLVTAEFKQTFAVIYNTYKLDYPFVVSNLLYGKVTLVMNNQPSISAQLMKINRMAENNGTMYLLLNEIERVSECGYRMDHVYMKPFLNSTTSHSSCSVSGTWRHNAYSRIARLLLLLFCVSIGILHSRVFFPCFGYFFPLLLYSV